MPSKEFWEISEEIIRRQTLVNMVHKGEVDNLLESPEFQVLDRVQDYVVALAKYNPDMNRNEVLAKAQNLYDSRDQIPARKVKLQEEIDEARVLAQEESRRNIGYANAFSSDRKKTSVPDKTSEYKGRESFNQRDPFLFTN